MSTFLFWGQEIIDTFYEAGLDFLFETNFDGVELDQPFVYYILGPMLLVLLAFRLFNFIF